MTRQEEIELCELLAKLLVDMNTDSDEVFNNCIIGFTIARKELKQPLHLK